MPEVVHSTEGSDPDLPSRIEAILACMVRADDIAGGLRQPRSRPEPGFIASLSEELQAFGLRLGGQPLFPLRRVRPESLEKKVLGRMLVACSHGLFKRKNERLFPD